MATKAVFWHLGVHGSIGVVPTTPEELKGETLLVHILMGPTGSGKSTFVESLSSDNNLSISRDSLESVTKEVVCYRVVNLSHKHWGSTYILMDTPGFLDVKLSESRITRMITEKLDALRRSTVHVLNVTIFYFQPITDIRMSGSKRGAIELLRAYAESFGAQLINVVTTMWNLLSSHKQIMDANQRYNRLKSEIYTTTEDLDIDISKFETTEESALSIIDNSSYAWAHEETMSKNVCPQVYSLVRDNLLMRIVNTQQRLQMLADDKENAATHANNDPRLLEVICREEQATLTAQQSFLEDLIEIAPKALITRIAARRASAMLPSFSTASHSSPTKITPMLPPLSPLRRPPPSPAPTLTPTTPLFRSRFDQVTTSVKEVFIRRK